MNYFLKPTHFFLEQLEALDNKTIRILERKFILLKENPFRFKRIKGFDLLLFRVRFEDKRKEKRVIYLVNGREVELLCILDRDKEYKDLRRYLRNLKNYKT